MEEKKIMKRFQKNKPSHLKPWQKITIGVSTVAIAAIIVDSLGTAYFTNDYQKEYKDIKRGLNKCTYYESIYDALNDNDVDMNKYTTELVKDTTINRTLYAISCIEHGIEIEKNGKLLVEEAEDVETKLINSLKEYIQKELNTKEKIELRVNTKEVDVDQIPHTYVIVGEGNTANFFEVDHNIKDAIKSITSLQNCKRYDSSGLFTYNETTDYKEFAKIMKEAILKNASIVNLDLEATNHNTKIKTL